MPPSDRIPPQNLEAEQVVLGALMIDIRLARDVVFSALDPEDFYVQAHRDIMSAIAVLISERQPVDLYEVTTKLRDMGLLDAIGGQSYLATCIERCPTAHYAEHYSQQVKECSLRRQLIRNADQAINDAYEPTRPLVDVLSSHEQQIANLRLGVKTERTYTRLNTLVRQQIQQQRTALATGVSAGYKTGWYRLNQIIPPLQPGWVVMFGSRPKMGKTTAALNVVKSFAQQDLPGIIFSEEMDKESLSLRAMLSEMSTYAHKDLLDIEGCRNHDGVMIEFSGTEDALHQLAIDIDDRPSLKVSDIADTLMQYSRDYGRMPAWVMIDFMQLCQPERRSGNLAADLGNIAYGIKEDIAKRFKVLVICLGQFNRDCEDQPVKRPSMHHFEGSGKIEQSIDIGISLYRPGQYGDDECERAGYDPERHKTYTEFGVMGSRHGAAGQCCVLDFDGAHYRFNSIPNYTYHDFINYQKAQAAQRKK
jgi:replicative DNA helicase